MQHMTKRGLKYIKRLSQDGELYNAFMLKYHCRCSFRIIKYDLNQGDVRSSCLVNYLNNHASMEEYTTVAMGSYNFVERIGLKVSTLNDTLSNT